MWIAIPPAIARGVASVLRVAVRDSGHRTGSTGYNRYEQEAGRYKQETSRKSLDCARGPVIRETRREETRQNRIRSATAKIEWLGRARRPSGLLKSMGIHRV